MDQNVLIKSTSQVGMCPRKDDHVTRTFRIPIEFDESLREDAEAHGTSVNSLVIKILEKYNESDRFFGQGQYITFSPTTLTNILKELDNEGVRKAGNDSGYSVPRSRLLLKGMPINRISTIKYITDIIGGYDDWFTCNHYERKDHTLLHLRHVYDMKWSIFLEAYMTAMFIDLLDLDDIDFEITNASLTVRVPK
ncbi:Arc family DNA-binding protein [archaeon]|nr:Arc family DNA-binding protein [archaeon]